MNTYFTTEPKKISTEELECAARDLGMEIERRGDHCLRLFLNGNYVFVYSGSGLTVERYQWNSAQEILCLLEQRFGVEFIDEQTAYDQALLCEPNEEEEWGAENIGELSEIAKAREDFYGIPPECDNGTPLECDD